MSSYLFTSERLGFRNWKESDIPAMHAISSDLEVMRYFPKTQSLAHTSDFVKRMQDHYNANGFCYFAVDIAKTGEFIGFIGMCWQTYKVHFNPAVDIGWRLHKTYWGNGYASEGAKACLAYGFNTLKLERIVAVAPQINIPSVAVMKKIGMSWVEDFEHPLLTEHPELQVCALYEINR